MLKSKILLSLFFFLNANTLYAATVLNCGRLIDVQNEKVLEQMSVKIKGKKIVSVKKGFSKSKKAIDLKNKTCLPGLIDLHVHLEQNFPEILGFHHPDEARMLIDTMGFAGLNLMAGFTTIRDLASIRNIPAQMQYAIAEGKMVGPRIVNVGHPVSATGGHGDFFTKLNVKGNPLAREKYKAYYGFRFIDKVSDVEPWFKYYFHERPDWYKSFKSIQKTEELTPGAVKIMATGGVVSDNPNSYKPQLSAAVVKEVVRQAKKQSKRLKRRISITAHAHGLEGIANVVFGGVHSVEHATELFADIDDKNKGDEKRAALRNKLHNFMRTNEVYVVPTLLAADTVVALAKKGKLPKHIAKKAIRVGQKMKQNFQQVVASNIPVAFGSDTGISAHGQNWREFLLMVEFGMTPLKALKAATLSGSKVLGMQNKIGSITVGKWADIIAVDGKPDQNIKDIENVEFVMKDGVVYKNKL